MKNNKTTKKESTKAKEKDKDAVKQAICSNPYLPEVKMLLSAHEVLLDKIVKSHDPLFIGATLHSVHSTMAKIEMDMIWSIFAKQGAQNGEK